MKEHKIDGLAVCEFFRDSLYKQLLEIDFEKSQPDIYTSQFHEEMKEEESKQND